MASLKRVAPESAREASPIRKAFRPTAPPPTPVAGRSQIQLEAWRRFMSTQFTSTHKKMSREEILRILPYPAEDWKKFYRPSGLVVKDDEESLHVEGLIF